MYLATDHAGFEIKNKVAQFLKEQGHEIEDCGPFEYDKNDDYPDWISKAAEKVSLDPGSFGVVFGGSGQGEAIVANKFKNVRCALFYAKAIPTEAIDISGESSQDPFEILKLTRGHNNSNMLSIGIRFLKEEDIMQAIKIFLESSFTGEERHLRRIEKISNLEE